MFAFVSILPVDHMIVSTNLAFKDMPESRICWNQLRWLSADILTFVREHPEIRDIKSDCNVVSQSKDWYKDITQIPSEIKDLSVIEEFPSFWPNAVFDNYDKTNWSRGEVPPAWIEWTLTDFIIYYRYNFSDYYTNSQK